MARTKRRIKIYLVIFIVSAVVALFLPSIIRVISDCIHKEPSYYYPHDREREDFLDKKERK